MENENELGTGEEAGAGVEKHEKIEDAGRGTDSVIAHLSLGEIVIPRAVQDDPEVQQMLDAIFQKAGADRREFTVGDEANKINPETGYPEFGFFRKIASFASGGLLKPLLPKSVQNVIDTIAPIALTAIGQPELAAGYTTLNNYGNGASLGKSLTSGVKTYALGKIGDAVSGALGDYIGNSAIGNAASNLYNGSTLQDLYTGASGALNKATSGISDLYNGSALQSTFKSGGDVLKSVGLNTSPNALGDGIGASAGGAPSQYSAAEQGLLDKANSVLTGTKGATNVANLSNYASPIASALLGTYTNNKAQDQLLKQQQANQALLAPYQNFKFTPGDLTQDPGYQFNLAQGNQALDRQQLAKGGYFSGAALKEAQDYGQGLADNTYNAAFNRALQTQGAGLQAAGALAGVNDNIGNIKANSTVNTGNLYSGALGAILPGQPFTNSGALAGGNGDYLSNLLRQLKLQGMAA